MAKTKKTGAEKMSRSGMHKEGKTLFGCYVEPEIKALAIMTSERLGITFTQIILNGLMAEATRAGIVVNGGVAPEFRADYDDCVALTRAKINGDI